MIQVPGPPAVQPASGRVYVMCGCDIVGFTRGDRDDGIQLYLRKALYEMLHDAFEGSFRGSGVAWEHCEYHDRGDGALIMIPPGIPAQVMIDPFPERLSGLIRGYNRIVKEPARMQLRVAVNIGPVYRDDHGIAGEDVTLLCRMLETRELRRVLADSGAELALIVSAHVYDSLVRGHPTLVDPACFQPLKTRVKRTSINAWIYVPGSRPP